MNQPGQNASPSLTGGNPEEVINLPCPSCSKVLHLRRKHLGIRGKCVHCGEGVTAVLDSVGEVTLVTDLPEPTSGEGLPATSAHAIAPESKTSTNSQVEAESPAESSWGQPAPVPETPNSGSFLGGSGGFPPPASQESELSEEVTSSDDSEAPTATGFLTPHSASPSEREESGPDQVSSFGAPVTSWGQGAPAPSVEPEKAFPQPETPEAPEAEERPAFTGGFAPPAMEPAADPEPVGFLGQSPEPAEPKPSFSGGMTDSEAQSPSMASPFAPPAKSLEPEASSAVAESASAFSSSEEVASPETSNSFSGVPAEAEAQPSSGFTGSPFGTPPTERAEEPASVSAAEPTSAPPFSGGFTAPSKTEEETAGDEPKQSQDEPAMPTGFSQPTPPPNQSSSPFGPREEKSLPKEEAKPEPKEETPTSFASSFGPPAATPFGASPEAPVFAEDAATPPTEEPGSAEPSEAAESSSVASGFSPPSSGSANPPELPDKETSAVSTMPGTSSASPFGAPADSAPASGSPFASPSVSPEPESTPAPSNGFAESAKQEETKPTPEPENSGSEETALSGTTAGFLSPPPIPAAEESKPKASPELTKEEKKAALFEDGREKFTSPDSPPGLSPFTTGSAKKAQPGFAEALFDKENKEPEKPAVTPPEQPQMPSAEAIAASAADQQWGPTPAEKKEQEAIAAVAAAAAKASMESAGSEDSVKPSRMVLKGKGNSTDAVLKLLKTFLLSVVLAAGGFAAYKFTPEEKWLEWKNKAVEWLEPGSVILQDTPFAKPGEQPGNPAAAGNEEGPSEEEPDTFRVE